MTKRPLECDTLLDHQTWNPVPTNCLDAIESDITYICSCNIRCRDIWDKC